MSNPLKIMVVDDEPAALELVRAMLEPLGADVVTCVDSRKAAEQLESQKFDGIFVDVIMPHLDGFELTRRIRASSLNGKAPVVLLTGADDVETMRQGFKAGSSLFLGKPISRERIAALFLAMRGPMLSEKRRHLRLPLRTTVTAHWGVYGEKRFTAQSLNIGEGGMLVQTSEGLEKGSEVTLEFSIPMAKRPLRVRARVAHKEAGNRIGVEFLEMLELDRAAIRNYMKGDSFL